MNPAAIGEFVGGLLSLLAVQYVVAGIFLLRPLKQRRMLGFYIGAALTLLLTISTAVLSGGHDLWLAWAIVTGFMHWRARQVTAPEKQSVETRAGEKQESTGTNGPQRTGILKSLADKAVWIVAFVIAFSVAAWLKQEWFQKNATEQVAERVNRDLDAMRESAVKANPDVSVAEAVKAESIKQSQAKLETIAGEKRADEAAGQFLGFWLINARSRHDYCLSRGVDISPFTNAFKKAHAALYAKSRSIHSRGPMSPEKIESTMLTTLKPTFDKLLKDDMGGIGQAYSLTEVEVCELFREQGDAVAKELQLEKVNPALFKALTEAP